MDIIDSVIKYGLVFLAGVTFGWLTARAGTEFWYRVAMDEIAQKAKKQ